MTGPVKSVRPADLHAQRAESLTLAAHGFFWVGGERVETASGPALRGQMYVEYWIPQALRHPWPLVLIHGGGGQGLDFLGTVDGREGWPIGSCVEDTLFTSSIDLAMAARHSIQMR